MKEYIEKSEVERMLWAVIMSKDERTIEEMLEDASAVTAIPVPDGATNGDVIKIMFPDAEVTQIRGSFRSDELLGYRVWLGGRSQDYLLEWWNEPFRNCTDKRGNENESID